MVHLNEIRTHMNRLIKPQGSLGQWETLAERLCLVQQSLQPVVRPAELVVFAADHGVVESGVTLWPSMVTTVMIEQIALGKSASAVLAQLYGLDYRIVDVGSVTPPRITHPRLSVRRIGPGTKNMLRESAMTVDEFREALSIGEDEAKNTLLRDARVVIAGDMGIGNTTSASCIARLLADVPLEHVVGTGAGTTTQSLEKKRSAVQIATERVMERCGQLIDEAAIASVGGFEIVAMAGFFVQCAKQQQTVLVDGMIATAGALIAQHIYPEVSKQLIAAHESQEPAHAQMLSRLRLVPMLKWNMRLGEGTGALALFPLLAGAAAWTTQMEKLENLRF
ncbi:MAG TPA: nicotinate-nucleotide--dimethylbenzimidazole phosphoribosyltransferase [Pirellula sp.]|nr:nicotinate-nucleotide--dimethylbenzimidazole phosphoribosyltransferase [Pirellula sp.]